MITYCTNVHPGESWREVFRNLRQYVPAVKSGVFPDKKFPVGLRLSARAARELDENRLEELADWCREQDCFIPTVNGFVHGSFHAAPVKELAYLPDWRSPERVDYTKRLTELLAVLLPPRMTGSISTVPVCFGRKLDEADFQAARKNLVAAAEDLDRARNSTGKDLVLALEPEPGCFLETIEDAAGLFDRLRLPAGLRDCLGICLDCCHHAIGFEDPARCIRRIKNAGIRMAKVQVSSAPHVDLLDNDRLSGLNEPVYLHQVAVRRLDGTITRYTDIPEALREHRYEAGCECRVHFHIPVFLEEAGGYRTTQSFISGLLPLLDRDVLLEVETYAWSVLPPALRSEPLQQSLIREIRWTEAQAACREQSFLTRQD